MRSRRNSALEQGPRPHPLVAPVRVLAWLVFLASLALFVAWKLRLNTEWRNAVTAQQAARPNQQAYHKLLTLLMSLEGQPKEVVFDRLAKGTPLTWERTVSDPQAVDLWIWTDPVHHYMGTLHFVDGRLAGGRSTTWIGPPTPRHTPAWHLLESVRKQIYWLGLYVACVCLVVALFGGRYVRHIRHHLAEVALAATVATLVAYVVQYDVVHAFRTRGLMKDEDLLLRVCLFVGSLVLLWRFRQRLTSQAGARCKQCGYDLTGNVSGVCPECGREIGSFARGREAD